VAAFTELDDATMQALCDGFGLGRVASWQPIAAGTINSNFTMSTAARRYFLRINEDKSPAEVRYEAELVAALAAAGVTTPAPLPAPDGAPYLVADGKLVSVFPWVDGVHRCTAAVTPADAAAVGRELAELHLRGLPLAARFEQPGIYTFAAILERLAGFASTTDPALVAPVALLKDEAAWQTARLDARRAAPRGVIHADLFRDNVLFGEHGIVALLDFEQAATGSLVYDLAVCINAWCFTTDFVGARVAALVRGYDAVRPLTAADDAALAIECRAAAMRFAVTRITDVYLRDTVSTKDFRRYLARLERWRALGPAGSARLAGRRPR
jgi:homoserine kinase type II